MKEKRNVALGAKLHQTVKIAVAKEGITIEAFVSKALWSKLGHAGSYKVSEGY